MNKRVQFSVLVASAILLMAVAMSWAQAPDRDVAGDRSSATRLAPSALGNTIGYQGVIERDGSPVNGQCDVQFSLWNAAGGGSQIGSPQTKAHLDVRDGLFMAELDFGDGAFNGDPRWLQIAVRCPAGSGGYTTLSPRTPVLASPYALYAGNSDKLDGVDSSGFLSTGGGTVYGGMRFSAGPQFHTWEVGSYGLGFPAPVAGWFYIQDNSDTLQPLRLIIKDDTGDVVVAHRLGVGAGADPPGNQLHVAGDSQFDGLAHFSVGGGEISISTPEGQPGLIAYAPNGYRRDIKFTNNLLQLLANDSSGITSNTKGINIASGGNVGVGTTTPEKRFHVVGESQFNGQTHIKIASYAGHADGGLVSFTTPGGWPGLIAYAPNGHRREIHIKDDRLNILVSDSHDPSPNDNGISITESGTVGVKVLQITGGSDLAEPFDLVQANSAQPGMVLAIDPQHPGQLRVADQAYDRKVAGCVSGANDVQPGLTMQQEGTAAAGALPVALAGRVYCWADSAYGPIEPGDLLTTSGTPGHAMRVREYDRAQGAIIGKAMTPLQHGRGLVLVLVTLQ